MAGERRPGRLRVGHRRRLSHAALPRAAADADARRRPTASCSSTASRRGSRLAAGSVAAVDAALRARRDCIRAASTTSSTFAHEPWPRWTFALPDGSDDRARDASSTAVDGTRRRWPGASHGGAGRATLQRAAAALGARLPRADARERRVRFRRARRTAATSRWRPYADVPAIAALSNGAYAHEPDWYRNFLYARGSGARPRLRRGPGLARHVHASTSRAATRSLVLRAGDGIGGDAAGAGRAHARRRSARAARRSRRSTRAADAYVVRRGARPHDHRRLSVVHRLGPRHVHRDARPAARARPLRRRARRSCWTGPATVSRGHAAQPLPRSRRGAGVQRGRRIAVVRDRGRTNSSRAASADAATCATGSRPRSTRSSTATRAGTRYGIRMDGDGLLACGVPGVQLTWMDAKVGDRVITPRIGKPVEVQALWINALRCAGGRYAAMADRAQAAFRARFWNAARRLPVRRGRRRSRRRAASMRACARTRSSPSAACRSRSSTATTRARGRRDRRARAPDADGPAHAGARRSRLLPALRRRRRAARRRLSPGHGRGRGSSARSSTRGCACTATTPRIARRRGVASSRRSKRICKRRAWAMSAKSPTAMRRTRRAAARSRRGRWAN